MTHEPPIRMVQDAKWLEDNVCSATLTIPEESPYLCGDILIPEMCLEIMAQCFACACGKRYGPNDGYLAGIRDFSVRGDVRSRDRLRVRCEVDGKIGDIWIVSGKMWLEENTADPVAESEFKIFIPESIKCG